MLTETRGVALEEMNTLFEDADVEKEKFSDERLPIARANSPAPSSIRPEEIEPPEIEHDPNPNVLGYVSLFLLPGECYSPCVSV